MTPKESFDIQLARLRVRYAKTPLPRFFAWWRGELVGLLPARFRGVFAERIEELLIGKDERQFALWHRSGGAIAALGGVALDAPAEQQRDEFARLRAPLQDPALRVYYCIEPSRSLRRELSLPAAAEDRLRQVLAFEMDRQTPFKADQVWFDYRLGARDEAGKSLRIDLAVVPRGPLDAELRALAVTGAALDGVDVWRAAPGGARSGLNLLPAERRVKHVNRRWRLNLALAVGALLLAGACMWQLLANREQAIAAMTEEVDKAKNEAKTTAVLMKQLQDNIASANHLSRVKSQTVTAIELLADLAHRLPDDTFLERLSMDEKGKVEIQGQSDNAAKLIEGLQKSDVLDKAMFTGTVQTDARTHKERFNMSFELRSRAPAEPAPADGKAPNPTPAQDKPAEAAHAPAA